MIYLAAVIGCYLAFSATLIRSVSRATGDRARWVADAE